MTHTPSITTPPAARSLADLDAAKRIDTQASAQSDIDTGSLQDCVDRHQANPYKAVPLPHAGPVPTPLPLGPCPVSEPQIASLSLPQDISGIEPRVVTEDWPQVASVNPTPPKEYIRAALGGGIAIKPGPTTTRLKMTLHNLTPLNTSADDPLTRCTFGAVYSPNPTEEDGVYGKYTPYGSLSYNVRSDIAANLVPGRAYYIDIYEAES